MLDDCFNVLFLNSILFSCLWEYKTLCLSSRFTIIIFKVGYLLAQQKFKKNMHNVYFFRQICFKESYNEKVKYITIKKKIQFSIYRGLLIL